MKTEKPLRKLLSQSGIIKTKKSVFTSGQMKQLKDKVQARYDEKKLKEKKRLEEEKQEQKLKEEKETRRKEKAEEFRHKVEIENEKRKQELQILRQKEADRRRKLTLTCEAAQKDKEILIKFDRMQSQLTPVSKEAEVPSESSDLSLKEIMDELNEIDKKLAWMTEEGELPDVSAMDIDAVLKESILQSPARVSEEVLVPEEIVPVVVAAAEKQGKTPKKRCSNCGGRGHLASTCDSLSKKQLKKLSKQFNLDLHKKSLKKKAAPVPSNLDEILKINQLIPAPIIDIPSVVNNPVFLDVPKPPQDRPTWVEMCDL